MFYNLFLGRGLEPRFAGRGGDHENGELAGFSRLSQDAGAKPRIAQKRGFDPFWAEIAAIGRDDKVVPAAIDSQEAVRVEAADVACMPFARRRIAVQVAIHDGWAFNDDLAVFDCDLKTRQRRARS